MMRITRTSDGDALGRFRLEGRLTDQSLAALSAAIEPLLSTGRAALLDLGGITYADAPAAAYLDDLRRRGTVLAGTSGFVAQMLAPAPAHPDASPPEEAALVDRLRRGEDDAFADLVGRYGGRLLSVAKRLLRDGDEAEDAVQEAFLSAFRSIDGFHGQSRLSTWLHRIVVNAALMRLRRHKRRGEQSIEELLPRFDGEGYWADEPSTASLPCDELIDAAETRTLVRRCIDQLPETYRAVLLLRDIEDLDTAEAAAVLGVTANAVKVRLHRARQALRTILEREAAATPRPAADIEAAETDRSPS